MATPATAAPATATTAVTPANHRRAIRTQPPSIVDCGPARSCPRPFAAGSFVIGGWAGGYFAAGASTVTGAP